MKKILAFATLFAFPLVIFSQDISGLWKGSIYNDSTKQSLPYELFIKKEKGKYTGYSQSGFLVDGKECYGIRKVKVTIAKDGKIVIKEKSLLENNFPVAPDKNVHQLDVLDLSGSENERALVGLFVTNLTKQYMELTGHINIKKTDNFSESSLVKYLDKKNAENSVAKVK